MPGDTILETRGLTKEFKGFVAVDNVDLKVRRGTIHALIGPNGAGKTTTFNLLTKFLPPTRGTILFNGEDITGDSPRRRGAPRRDPLVPDLGGVPEPHRCSRTCASPCNAASAPASTSGSARRRSRC
jgi:ABC-type multidrug transport system ATPase subunit